MASHFPAPEGNIKQHLRRQDTNKQRFWCRIDRFFDRSQINGIIPEKAIILPAC